MKKNKMLLEDSFNKLYRNTTSGFVTDRDNNSNRIQLTTTFFIPSNDSLQIRAKAKSDGPIYDTVAFFNRVEYSDENNPDAISFIAPDNSKYYINQIDGNENVQVNCTCLDFYYRFAVWNNRNNSLYGDAPAPYIKKTDRLSQNPRRLPGLCKHLLKLFDYLEREQIIK